MKVFIGVGHGGNDPGAVANGFKEKDVNLVMALAMKSELERHGVQVGISRTSDINDPLADEIAKCNAFAPDIAVEVHNNAGGGKGFEVYYQTGACKAQSLSLARAIETQVTAIGQNSRGCKTRLNDTGSDYFGWLRQMKCPAVLCEGAFLDNANDVKMIDTETKQQAFGSAYAKGVLDYLGIPDKGAQGEPVGLTLICGKALATVGQMRAYLATQNPTAPDYAAIYLEEGEKEGIRGDIAFAQSCLETGHFKFGGDVKPEQNNFCGLGATGGGGPGNSFPTPQEGIRAQIQHLKAYAATSELSGTCVDPRFKWVQRGVSPYVEWLGIPDNPQGKGWAVGQGYGAKILAILDRIKATAMPVPLDDVAALKAEIEVLKAANAAMRRDIAALAGKYT